ncbi:MAG: hypothetical protein K6A44_02855 [bacterium]|nr:hypothetical protein [bacterium]
MKKLLLIICTGIFTVFSFTATAEALSLFNKKQPQPVEQDFNEVELDIQNIHKHKIQKTEPAKKIEGVKLSPSDEAKIKLFQVQKKQDVEDITNLWKATVERNNVIKFALKKVTMNPEERKKHSSKMARSISALINGATLLPYMFGLDASIASAAAAGASLTTQAAKNKLGFGPQNIPVTDTELIQLASLIEELQNGLIKNYYSYKSSIELLKDCRSKIAVYKKNYNIALAQKDEANILVTKSLYDKQLLEEIKLKNQIKAARIELERFAGEETVNNLNLATPNQLQATGLEGGEL